MILQSNIPSLISNPNLDGSLTYLFVDQKLEINYFNTCTFFDHYHDIYY